MISLAERIKGFRKSAGISQEELSDLLKVSRPAISQIESGRRKLSASELIRLARIFGTSIDVLVDAKNEPRIVMEGGEEMKRPQPEVRISVPQRNLKKFREVLLYILNQVGSKPNVGQTVIYKLLYFIDFDYYERHERQLIGARYQKNRFGPTPMEFASVVKRMIDADEMVPVRSKYFKYPQTKYLPLRAPDLSELTADEMKVIDEVLAKHSDKTAAQISEYSHGDVPWLATKDDGIIRYESVFYRTSAYSVRTYSDDIPED